MPNLPPRTQRQTWAVLVGFLGILFSGYACAEQAADATKSADHEAQMRTQTIVDFDSDSKPWRVIDDVVMGGVSESRMRVAADTAVFEGNVSLENNGGFASVRSDALGRNLAGWAGVRIRVKGDGKRYQFRIRTSAAFDGPAYQTTFGTEKGRWIEVDLPFSGFVATFRGRVLPQHPPLDPAAVADFGFLIADKQEGGFMLEIDWIKAYCGRDSAGKD